MAMTNNRVVRKPTWFPNKFNIALLLIFVLVVPQINFSQENDADDIDEDEYYELWATEGITIYGERSPTEIRIINALNSSLSSRRNFIENDLLVDSGFRRSANVRFRKTSASEKGLSILHGFGNLLSFGIIPMTSFFEIDYARLPRGQYYSFESVIIHSEFTNLSLEIYNMLKLEYMLQIEFTNGIIISDTLNYYTEENIGRFENLILSLPDSPDNIRQFKERYLTIELPKIRRAIYRYNNPSEDNLRAMENSRGSFRIR